MNANDLKGIATEGRRLYSAHLQNLRALNALFLRAWKEDQLDALWWQMRDEFGAERLHCLQYFIRQRGTGDIKLGRTNSIKKRFGGLLNGSSRGIDLIACYPADAQHEADLKRDFASCHLRGEWFYPRAVLLDYLRLLGVDPETFTDKPFPPFPRGRGFKPEWLS
jgi:hypothetical protein